MCLFRESSPHVSKNPVSRLPTTPRPPARFYLTPAGGGPCCGQPGRERPALSPLSARPNLKTIRLSKKRYPRGFRSQRAGLSGATGRAGVEIPVENAPTASLTSLPDSTPPVTATTRLPSSRASAYPPSSPQRSILARHPHFFPRLLQGEGRGNPAKGCGAASDRNHATFLRGCRYQQCSREEGLP